MVFPQSDPVGPLDGSLPPGTIAFLHEQVAARAAATDTDGVLRETLVALGTLGFYDIIDVSPGIQRERAEVLAGCDATTWFCWVQHFTPMRTLAEAVEGPENPGVVDLRAIWLDRLRLGEAIGAIAFAHLRRPGRPNPVATRVDDGWILNGTLDWITTWDIAEVVLVMAYDEHRERVVQVLLPAGMGPIPMNGFDVGEPLELFAMGGTHTRPAKLHDVHVPMANVVGVVPARDWLAQDDRRTIDVNPATFGVARGAIAELEALATKRDDEIMLELVADLTVECRSLRSDAYARMGSPDHQAQRLMLRAKALDHVVRATTAVVIARAGAAMMSNQDSTRRVREAMFLQVQAQTAATRAAALRLAIDGP